MGKNLKGKECGKGICQRKDGKYTARYTAQNGSRREMHFNTLPEARNCLADEQYGQCHGIVTPNSDMTVDMWFDYWMTNLICDLAPNTKCNYSERYRHNIQPVIGSIKMWDDSLTNAVRQFESACVTVQMVPGEKIGAELVRWTHLKTEKVLKIKEI